MFDIYVTTKNDGIGYEIRFQDIPLSSGNSESLEALKELLKDMPSRYHIS